MVCEAKNKEEQEIFLVKEWLIKKDWCLGLALTGSRAWKRSENIPREDDEDYDFLVIVREGWLWRGRAETLRWAGKMGRKRKRGEAEGKNGWCFNLWLSGDSERKGKVENERGGLVLPEVKRSFFSLGELFQAEWIINRQGVSERLIEENLFWIRELAEGWGEASLSWRLKREGEKGGESRGGGESEERRGDGEDKESEERKHREKKGARIGEIIGERVCYGGQRLYMSRLKKRAEIVNLRQAFFHPILRQDDVSTVEEKRKKDKIVQKMKDQIKIEEGRVEKLPTAVAERLKWARERGMVVVLVTGVFDLLHEGHQEFLKVAKNQGEILIVGLESDKRAKKIKGNDRPRWSEVERFLAVSRAEGVDGVVILPDDFEKEEKRELVMSLIKPDLLVVSPQTLHLVAKKKMMEKLGGDLRVVKAGTEGKVSTTKLLRKTKSVSRG